MFEVKTTVPEIGDETRSVVCSRCNGKTKHAVLARVLQHAIETIAGHTGYEAVRKFDIVQCRGCEEISFVSDFSCSEDYFVDPLTEEGEYPHIIQVYPPRQEGLRLISDSDMDTLPFIVMRIYQETHRAASEGNQILAGMGIRALIEAVCKEKSAPGDNLFQKIDGLVGLGVLTHDGADILHKLRLLGNEAAHEHKPPTDETIEAAIQIAEHLLQTVYVLPVVANRLAQSRKSFKKA